MPKGKHPHNRLTAAHVRKLGPGFHADGGGLYLNVDQGGGRGWILRTVVHGRRRDIGLGAVALVGLAEAREEARRLRKVARAGGDPIAERDKDKRRTPTFDEAARYVFETQILPVSKRPETLRPRWLGRLEIHASPHIGSKQIHTITQADMLAVLEPIWLTKRETARRVKQMSALIFDWGRTAEHMTGANPLDGIKAGLSKHPRKVRHHPALPWADMPTLWPRLVASGGIGALALRFLILTAVRTIEVRGMLWDELDGDVWSIPAERMKMDDPHRVPLSPEALAIIERARGLHPTLVFPGTGGRMLSDRTLTAVVRRLDILPNVATVHGFRSTFRTWADEQTGYEHAVKETALAHAAGRNNVERAYLRTDLLEPRRPLMNDWSRYVTSNAASVSE